MPADLLVDEGVELAVGDLLIVITISLPFQSLHEEVGEEAVSGVLQHIRDLIVGRGREHREVVRDFLLLHLEEDRLGGEQHFIGPGRPAVTGVQEDRHASRIQISNAVKNLVSHQGAVLQYFRVAVIGEDKQIFTIRTCQAVT